MTMTTSLDIETQKNHFELWSVTSGDFVITI
uniref:Uncharacterized protein n=1 Tax=Leuconostoc citreum TaxID=33964 RepID=A0A098DN26_LEUCI|nr:Protein of unknown function [Leuconostoc citreum]